MAGVPVQIGLGLGSLRRSKPVLNENCPHSTIGSMAVAIFFYPGTDLEAPNHLARTAHNLYFEPKHKEFRSRTIWSLSSAFTSAFKADSAI